MKTLLLYNLYPKNHWRELSLHLLKDVPHDDILVNISLDWKDNFFWKRQIIQFVQAIPKVRKVIVSKNEAKIAEVAGFDNMRKNIEKDSYSILTYFHSKGVTKPNNPNIGDWVELMRYFQIDRFELCLKAFEEGYGLYGVNLGKYEGGEKYGPFKFSNFHFSGTFVSVNMELLGDKFFSTPCDRDYFGVEGFFGKLCPIEKVYCPHISGKNIQNHYREAYPPKFYKINNA